MCVSLKAGKRLDWCKGDIRGVRDGGIVGRNTFQHPNEDALETLTEVIDTCFGKA